MISHIARDAEPDAVIQRCLILKAVKIEHILGKCLRYRIVLPQDREDPVKPHMLVRRSLPRGTRCCPAQRCKRTRAFARTLCPDTNRDEQRKAAKRIHLFRRAPQTRHQKYGIRLSGRLCEIVRICRCHDIRHSDLFPPAKLLDPAHERIRYAPRDTVKAGCLL